MRPRRFVTTVITLALLVAGGPAAADTSTDPPIADPIPAPITMSGLEVRLEHVVTIPASGTSPLTRINTVTHAGDGSGRLFVPDLRGDLWVVEGSTPSVYLDVAARFPDFTDSPGLGSGFGFVAFHPGFATNGRFLTVHTEAGAALGSHTPDFSHQLGDTIHGVITEWTAADPAAAVFSGTSREVLRIGFATTFHGIQQIAFGPDDLLYIGTGDGDNATFSTGAQALDRAQGKLLRIDPDGTDSANGAYGIPPTNPFVGTTGAVEEIYALGFRNPHRFSWDEPSGKLLLGNIGQANIEAVHQILPQANHGWNEREGSFLWDPATPLDVYPLPAGDAALGYTYPVAQYDHDEGDAIVGGFVHRHESVPELYGQYLFGDIANGRVFHAAEAEMVLGAPPAPIGELRLFDETDTEVTLLGLSGSSRVDLRFGTDEAGTVLLLSKRTGAIHRLTSRNPQPRPTIEPGVVEVTETPGGSIASIPLTLSAPTPLPVTVDVATVALPPLPGRASAADFIAAAATVEFAPMTTAATFEVTITDDALDESDELMVALASNPVHATVGGFFGLGLVRILDDDPAPTLTPGGFVAAPEGDTGSTVWSLPVTLSAPSGRIVTVEWAVIDIPENPAVAHPGSDVASASGTLTFPPGETNASVPVEVLGDTLDEPPLLYGEWGLVQFTQPADATITGGFFGHGLFIVIDDD